MAARNPTDPQLGAALRRLRLERGTTQEEIARDADLTLSGYGNIERATSAPAWITVRKIAEALGLTLAELATEVEKEPGGPPP